jgi:thymidine phosphorylase
LRGEKRDKQLLDVTVELCATLLQMTGLAQGENARKKVQDILDSGAAAERFAQMVSALGGPADLLENGKNYFPKAPIIRDITASEDGVLTAIDTKAVGMAVVALGGGRRTPTDTIDHAVGFDCLPGLGTNINKGDVLARLHARTEASAQDAERRFRAALAFGEAAPNHPLIADTITGAA